MERKFTFHTYSFSGETEVACDLGFEYAVLPQVGVTAICCLCNNKVVIRSLAEWTDDSNCRDGPSRSRHIYFRHFEAAFGKWKSHLVIAHNLGDITSRKSKVTHLHFRLPMLSKKFHNFYYCLCFFSRKKDTARTKLWWLVGNWFVLICINTKEWENILHGDPYGCNICQHLGIAVMERTIWRSAHFFS